MSFSQSKQIWGLLLSGSHQANHQPNLLLLGFCFRFNPTPTFLGVTFDRTVSFSKHVSSLKAKFFPRFKALRCIPASSCGPFEEFLSFLYKSFIRSLFTYSSPGWFPFLSATNFTKLECFHRVASRAITGCLSSSPIALLLSEASLPPLRVTLTHFTLFFVSKLFVPQPLFYFRFGQTWNETKTADCPGELLRSLTRSCFLLLVPGRFLLCFLTTKQLDNHGD